MKLKHFYPLLGFLVPTVAIAYGLVIPGSCIDGVNDKTIGFAGALLGASMAYWQGVYLAVRSARMRKEHEDATP